MTSIESAMQQIDWTPTGATDDGSGVPFATHSGVLEISGHSLRCYVLNTGQSIFHAEDLKKLFSDWGVSLEHPATDQ